MGEIKTCLDCGRRFEYTDEWRRWILDQGWEHPKRCPTCLARRREKTPEEKRFLPSSTSRHANSTSALPEMNNVFSPVFILLLLAFPAIVCGLTAFGFESMVVAAEGFFIFSGWAGLRAASLFRRQESEKLEIFRAYMAIGFGLSGGFLAAYLLLSTSEGQALTEWVTAGTIRIVGSLFVSVIGLGGLELAWRKHF
jgi:hypothetical protein